MKQIDNEIEYLNQMLLKMADIVLENINNSYLYFEGKNKEDIVVNDDIVDQYERLIESMCLDIIIKEHPYASDLRRVSGILKLVEDLERIGDHAEDILEFSHRLKKAPKVFPFNCYEFFQVSVEMVKNAITSFVKMDLNMAQSVIDCDIYMDTTYEEKIKEIIDAINEHDDGQFAIYTTLVVKYIERIADHAVNIAEWVIYIVNGYHKDKQIF